MKYRRIFHVEFRRGIDGESTKMCPLGEARVVREHVRLEVREHKGQDELRAREQVGQII